MSHFTALAAIAFPENLPAYFGSKLPDSCVAGFVERRQWLENHSLRMANRTETPPAPQITDQDRIECLAENLSAEVMEPYSENTENPAYLEFVDETEEGRSSYESKGIDCVRMPDGRIIPCYERAFSDRYELVGDKVYKRDYGPLHHRKRTKKAKRILPLPDYPLKKLYPSFDDFMARYKGCTRDEATGRYGYYSNPNAQWDWWQVGGRWPLRFLVKEDCPLVILGQPSSMFKEQPYWDAPEGYRWVAGARKGDIAWNVMRDLFQTQEKNQFQVYESWFQAHAVPPGAGYPLAITEDGIISWGEYVYRKGETLEGYLDRMGVSDHYRYPFSTFACVDGEGWNSQGSMGWFGISYDNQDEVVWNKSVNDFIARQPDDAVLISLDCHI